MMNKLFSMLLVTFALTACTSGSESQEPTTDPPMVKYPTTETELKTAISKVWEFPQSSDYVSLEFASDNTYTLLSRKDLSRATESNIYLISGTYIVSADLREITLTDFGKVKISSLDNDNVEMSITPTGGTATNVKLDEQKIAAPPASSDKRIKRVETVDDSDGNTSIEYSYTNGKLMRILLKAGVVTFDIPINYKDDKVWYELDAEVLGKQGVFKVTYTLNAAGLARMSVIEHNSTVVGKTYYTYDNKRQLISLKMTDNVGKFDMYCNATWSGGNVVSVYVEESHTCDGEFSEYDGVKVYHHDHNGDGVFDDKDIMIRDKYSRTYSYGSKENKGGYMHPMMTPEIFDSSDIFDQIGQWIGVLGVSCKNVMSKHGEDGTLQYTYDAAGYPTRIDVIYGDPSDNWYITQTFE